MKQAVADHRAITAKRFELQEQRKETSRRVSDLQSRVSKAQAAVTKARAELSNAEADYAATGEFQPVDAAMRALAVAQGEYDVAARTIQPIIQREEEAGRKIDGQLQLSAYQPRLPYTEAAAHLLRTSADVRLFVWLMREGKHPMTAENLRYNLGHVEGEHVAECSKAFDAMMAKA